MAEANSLEYVDAPEEDVGTITFLWNAYCRGKHVDIEIGIKGMGDSETFSAHKLVLAMWSPYFADRFYGKNCAQENLIFFEDVNPTAFKTMLEYLYGYHYFPKTVREARELHKVAVKFEIASLADRAQNIVKQTIPDVSNVFDLIEASEYLNKDMLKTRCLKLIYEKTSEVLESYDITDISPSRLQLVLESPKLSLESEYDLLKFMYAWGKNRFLTTPMFSSAREALEEFLPQLNFLALTNRQFAEFRENHPEFLTDQEVIAIFMNIAKADSCTMPDWHNHQIQPRVYTGKKN